MKKYFLLFIIPLFLSCQTIPIPSEATTIIKMAENQENQENQVKQNSGTYTLVVEGYDWGPGASKVILHLEESLSSVQMEDYTITVQKKAQCMGEEKETTSGERTILYAYISDEQGNKVDEGKHISLVLLVAPNRQISSPMQYLPACGGNVWTDYRMTIKDTSSNQVWDIEKDRIRPLVDSFNLKGKFVYNAEITLTFADFRPTNQNEKSPLIIWLHGGGEGGIDPSVPLMANRAANYASPEMQAYFGGAYVLVPQSPTFWMDNGKGEYTRGEVNDRYNESLMALIKAYVAEHPNIDTDRIYVGGCSNGGYMSLKLLLLNPDYFAAAFPSALAYHTKHITDTQLETIKDIPIWFIHSKDDPVTKAEETVEPVYKRLMAAGAKNVHFSNYDHVVDITGFFGGDNYHYLGHFSWIYSHANHSTLDYDGKRVQMNGKDVTLMEWLAAQRK